MGYTLATGGGSFRIAGGNSLSSKIRQTPLEISEKCSIFAYEEGDFIVAEIQGVTQGLYDGIKNDRDFVVVTLKVYNSLKKMRGCRSTDSCSRNSRHKWGFVSAATQRLSLSRNKYYFPKKEIFADRQLILDENNLCQFPTSQKLKRLMKHSFNCTGSAYYKVRIELQFFTSNNTGLSVDRYISYLSDWDVAYNSNANINCIIQCFPIGSDGYADCEETDLYSNTLKIYI